MKKKVLNILLAITIVAGILTGCGSIGTTTGELSKETTADGVVETEKKNLTIRVGDMPNFFLLKTADAKGFFEEEFAGDGINIEVINFVNAGPAIVEAFAAEELDIAILGGQPLIQARANNINIKAISSNNYTERGFALVAAEESGINSLNDLKGKKIAAAFGTNAHQMLLQFLDKAGIKEEEVEVVNLKSNEALISLESNEIDGAIFSEPQISIAVENGAKFITDATGYGNIVCVNVARNDFLQEYPDIAARFLKVLDKTQKWVGENREESCEINAAVSEQEPEDVAINYDSRDRKISIDDDKLKQPLIGTIAFLEKEGLINVKIAIDDVIDTSYYEASGIADTRFD